MIEMGASLPFAKAQQRPPLGGSRNSPTAEEDHGSLYSSLSEAYDVILT